MTKEEKIRRFEEMNKEVVPGQIVCAGSSLMEMMQSQMKRGFSFMIMCLMNVKNMELNHLLHYHITRHHFIWQNSMMAGSIQN